VAATEPGTGPCIAFGDFWDGSQRGALLSVDFTPAPVKGDPYWQVLDIDSGQATTYWQFRAFPFGRGERRVDTVVTPDGVICWRIRSTKRSPSLIVSTSSTVGHPWTVRGDTATAHLRNEESEAVVSLTIRPAPKWRFTTVGRGQKRSEVLRADLGRDVTITLVQRAAPLGQSSPSLAPTYHSFDQAAERTRDFWAGYWARSAVSLPDPGLAKWYRRSQYYLAANCVGATYPPGPMGQYPGRWGGRIFGHDLTYMHAALLTSNSADLSGRFVEWYLSHLPEARLTAQRSYHLPGARYGWEMNSRGAECAPAPFRDEHHVNAGIAWQAWRQAVWTGDRGLADRIKPLLSSTATFLGAGLRWDQRLHGYVSPVSTDLDEYAREVRGAVATQAGAEWLAQACREAGVNAGKAEAVAGQVYLPRLETAGGSVLTGHVDDGLTRTMKHPSPVLPIWWLSLAGLDEGLARRTFAETLTRVDLNRTPTFNRPWLAAAAARLHNGQRAAALLDDLITAPGALIDDTCFAETQHTRWGHFLTTAGALVAATNEMLLQSPAAGRVEMFPAVPPSWRQAGVSFGRLLTRGGVEVSGRLSPDEVDITLHGRRQTGELTANLPAPLRPVVTVNGAPASWHPLPHQRMEVRVRPPSSAPWEIRISARSQ